MSDFIPVTKSSMPPFEDYLNEIKSLWETKWLTNMGEKHIKLEKSLKTYLDVNNITLFSNGHLALESAISLFKLTGEIITTPFTFASTTHAITRNGLNPVFCDINSDDFTIDVNKIERLITERTTAILPVHVYGNICNVEGIQKIANKYNLRVIYDAAHCFGITYKGIGIGNFGDASMFSFHATKVFNTIEGGCLTYKNPEFKNILNSLKNFGITSPETVEYFGGNAKMNEFQAAMGICNLKYIDEEIEKRKSISDKYFEILSGIPGIELPKRKKTIKSNFSYFPVLFNNFKKTRDEVYEQLKSNSIFARKYFYPLTSNFECYKDQYNIKNTPIAEFISSNILTLPLYSDLSTETVSRICEIIKE